MNFLGLGKIISNNKYKNNLFPRRGCGVRSADTIYNFLLSNYQEEDTCGAVSRRSAPRLAQLATLVGI